MEATRPALPRGLLRRLVFREARAFLSEQENWAYEDESARSRWTRVLTAIHKGTRETLWRYDVVKVWKDEVRECQDRRRSVLESAACVVEAGATVSLEEALRGLMRQLSKELKQLIQELGCDGTQQAVRAKENIGAIVTLLCTDTISTLGDLSGKLGTRLDALDQILIDMGAEVMRARHIGNVVSDLKQMLQRFRCAYDKVRERETVTITAEEIARRLASIQAWTSMQRRALQATHRFKPGQMGVASDENGLVQEVSANGPARTNGIQIGDQIVKVGTEPYSKDALARAEKSGIPYEVSVKRTPRQATPGEASARSAGIHPQKRNKSVDLGNTTSRIAHIWQDAKASKDCSRPVSRHSPSKSNRQASKDCSRPVSDYSPSKSDRHASKDCSTPVSDYDLKDSVPMDHSEVGSTCEETSLVFPLRSDLEEDKSASQRTLISYEDWRLSLSAHSTEIEDETQSQRRSFPDTWLPVPTASVDPAVEEYSLPSRPIVQKKPLHKWRCDSPQTPGGWTQCQEEVPEDDTCPSILPSCVQEVPTPLRSGASVPSGSQSSLAVSQPLAASILQEQQVANEVLRDLRARGAATGRRVAALNLTPRRASLSGTSGNRPPRPLLNRIGVDSRGGAQSQVLHFENRPVTSLTDSRSKTASKPPVTRVPSEERPTAPTVKQPTYQRAGSKESTGSRGSRGKTMSKPPQVPSRQATRQLAAGEDAAVQQAGARSLSNRRQRSSNLVGFPCRIRSASGSLGARR